MADPDALKAGHALELEILTDFDRICTEEGIGYFLAYGTMLGAVRHHGFIPWDLDVDVMVTVEEYPRLMAALRKGLDPARWTLHWHEYDPEYDQLLARIGASGVSLLQARFDIFPIAGAPANPVLARLMQLLAHANYRAFFFKQVNIAVNYADRPRLARLARPIKVLLAPFPASVFIRIQRWLSSAVPLDRARWVHNICGSYGARERFPREWLDEVELLPFVGLRLPAPKQWDAYLRQMYGDYLVPLVRDHPVSTDPDGA